MRCLCASVPSKPWWMGGANDEGAGSSDSSYTELTSIGTVELRRGFGLAGGGPDCALLVVGLMIFVQPRPASGDDDQRDRGPSGKSGPTVDGGSIEMRKSGRCRPLDALDDSTKSGSGCFFPSIAATRPNQAVFRLSPEAASEVREVDEALLMNGSFPVGFFPKAPNFIGLLMVRIRGLAGFPLKKLSQLLSACDGADSLAAGEAARLKEPNGLKPPASLGEGSGVKDGKS